MINTLYNPTVDEQPIQDLALNVDNVFQADDYDAFDSDVDEAPMAQTMFMANLSSGDPIYDEVGPSYDSDILSEVHDHDYYQDVVCEHHKEHEMHDNVQLNHVVDSHADYTSDSNMISCDQYVKDNAVPGVQSNVSSVLNDAYMMIYNDMFEPHTQSVSKTSRNIVVDNSLTAELATYKEQVELYERRARFELTEREQKIDEQLRIGIQKALTKEIKDVFEELEAGVDQYVVDRKHDEIEQKNLLITNDKLIVECLSKEVFYVAMNSELIVSRFTKIHVAHTIVEARCLKLETKLSNLRDKIHNDNHNELVNRFSILEHYKELYDSIKITRAKHIEQVTALTTKNVNLKAQILNNVNSVIKDHVNSIVLTPGKYDIDVEPIPPRLRNNREARLDYLKNLKESVKTIYEIVEEDKVVRPFESLIVSACRYTKNSQELLEYEIGVNRCTNASGSQPRSNTKKNKISLAKGVNKMKVKEHPRTNKSHLRTTNHVDSSSRSKHLSNVYTISVEDMMKSFPIHLLSKASKNKSWLWHRHLNHLNFGTINDLARKDLVRGLPRLKFKKDHLCFACQLGKSKKHTYKPKTKNTNLEVLNTLHMDLCRPIRVQTSNGKKYILVIVDDYSRFTWVKFLRSKEETP
uniref:Integrase, catalytic region, zinc finger, CCHC-type, peptidase aspartic, catalytic n=1 Tax=Tanacetum cinerariifolium TaxID=118510 RepID=A0A6L2JDL9_TANCI|nr:integrase, catalytic region, zinc finger, CCHC-type, peptidase aspartic, catalytic [Tanacetum cinerariifolium]